MIENTKEFDLSVVIPLLNEEESLPELISWIFRVVDQENLKTEVILIDDGSTDQSWDVIKHHIEQYSGRVRGIRFNRNFGKSAALNTGFEHAVGRVVITMDADLQDSPEEIPALYQMIVEQGFDLVSGWKKERHDPISKTIPSKFFNWVTRKISGIALHDFNCGLKAYNSLVVKNIQVYGEMHRYIPYIAKSHGFGKITEKVVAHQARKYGSTKFGLERFIFGFLDLLSISFVSKFRKRPMHFFGTLGTLSFLFGTITTIWVIAEKLYLQFQHLPARGVTEQPLFFLSLVALIIGVQLFLTGFLAEMMALNTGKKNDYLIIDKVGWDGN